MIQMHPRRAGTVAFAFALAVVAVMFSPSSSADGATTLKAYVTGYSWWDNTPPGSADISNPVIHKKAGGVGTYANPTTVAVGHSIISGKDILDWPAGTRFYIPALKRYFIVEDTCGDGRKPQNGPCHVGFPKSATTWLDVWVGGKNSTRAKSDACMNNMTKVYTVVKDPRPGRQVTAGDIC